jgi:hypothetical protein
VLEICGPLLKTAEIAFTVSDMAESVSPPLEDERDWMAALPSGKSHIPLFLHERDDAFRLSEYDGYRHAYYC